MLQVKAAWLPQLQRRAKPTAIREKQFFHSGVVICGKTKIRGRSSANGCLPVKTQELEAENGI